MFKKIQIDVGPKNFIHPFTENPICPKCRETINGWRRYCVKMREKLEIGRVEHLYTFADEHIHVYCQKCEYRWVMHTADHGKGL